MNEQQKFLDTSSKIHKAKTWQVLNDQKIFEITIKT